MGDYVESYLLGKDLRNLAGMKIHSLRCVFTYSFHKNLPGTGIGARSKSVVSKTPSLPCCGILGRKMNKTIKRRLIGARIGIHSRY